MSTEPTHERGTSPTAADTIQAQLLLDRCNDLIGDQDYPRAAAAAQQAIDLVPNQPDPYVVMAEAMVGMDYHEHAVEAYDQAHQPSRPDQRYEILTGHAYSTHCNGDYSGTIEDLTDMIALQPGNHQCSTRRGIILGEVADYQGAIDDFDKAAAITGFDADLHNLLAHAHMHAAFAQLDDDAGNARPARELAQKALGHFQKALDRDPRHNQTNQGIQLRPGHQPAHHGANHPVSSNPAVQNAPRRHRLA